MNDLATAGQYNRDLANGTWVWCDRFDQEARTADGFCQYCGATDHTERAPKPTHGRREWCETKQRLTFSAIGDPRIGTHALEMATCPGSGKPAS